MQVAIVGAGLAGLGMGIMLRQAGIDDFEILERAHDVGGTWRANSYPGCCVDVQSRLYSYSFAPNPDWTHVYAPQSEIWAYARRCAERFGILGSVRFGHEVLGAMWDDEREHWLVRTTAGPVVARYLVSAVGPLSAQALPDISGLDSFQGARFHSAAWDHDHDFAGERVAVIGTGSSAAQIIPAIAPHVGRLLVFQRTPSWTFPRLNRRITRLERVAYRRLPVLQRVARERQYWYRESLAVMLQRSSRTWVLEALMRIRLRRQIPDAALRRQLTPRYRIGCKRIIVSDDYHKTFTRANVELITSPIEAVRERSIATRDGCQHGVDAIVLATGFHPIALIDPLVGRDGLSLAERWSSRREAYLGTTVAGYPNFFMLAGPNTITGHTSVLLYAEAQMRYVIACIAHLQRHGFTSFDVREDVQTAFNRGLQRRLGGTVWLAGGCGSWYLDQDGGSSVLWPGYTRQFERALRDFDPSEYVLRRAAAAGVG